MKSHAPVISLSVRTRRPSTDIEPDEMGHYPERRLWCAVIASAIEEYSEWIQRISVSWHQHQRPVQLSYKHTLISIRQQCHSEWFRMICEMADFSPDLIIRKFDQLDKEFCLASIPFEAVPEPVSPEWQLRRMRQQRKRLVN